MHLPHMASMKMYVSFPPFFPSAQTIDCPSLRYLLKNFFTFDPHTVFTFFHQPFSISSKCPSF